ncbi:DUF11 domain-containing protein, partial [bacterium]|nr:DUF11 domain-containing protein [bacterium]
MPPGTDIVNVAQAGFRVSGLDAQSQSNAVRVTTTIRATSSQLSFLRVDAFGVPQPVPACDYAPAGEGGPWLPQSPPDLPAGLDWTDGAPLPLAAAAFFHSGEPVFVQLDDDDQNLDNFSAETVILRIGRGDRAAEETLRLRETGPASGRFLGWVGTGEPSGDTIGDGWLGLGEDSRLVADYVDVHDPGDVSAREARVDPIGRVFDSETGAPVDGVRLRLETAAGQLAAPRGDDGASAFPATLTSGGSVSDAGGQRYDFPPGGYRYPLLTPGSYRLVVEPPPGWLSPSRASPTALQQLPGAPFALDSLASRGGVFVVEGAPTLLVDLPLDPVRATLFVAKHADRERAQPGDFVGYAVEVENSAGDPVSDLRLVDRLPRDFRYVPGTLRVDGRAATPTLSSDGTRLTLTLGALAPGERARVDYLLDVGPAARPGRAVNRVEAHATGAATQVAEAEVRVEDDPLAARARLVGRVLAVSADSLAGRPVAGARILLEDGRQVLTDTAGRYHFEDVAPGAHQLRLDPASLPGAPLAPDGLLRLVDVAAGTLWQEDFRVALGSSAQVARADSLPPAPHAPAFDAAWLAAQAPTLAWLWPPEGHHPEVPSTGVAVKHAPGWRVELALDGVPVPPLHRDGVLLDPAERVALSRWTGVDLHPGDNALTLRCWDETGAERVTLTRTLHYSGPPVRAELLADESVLVANGRDPLRVTLRLTDAAGHPARRGVTGPWRVSAPYRAAVNESERA